MEMGWDEDGRWVMGASRLSPFTRRDFLAFLRGLGFYGWFAAATSASPLKAALRDPHACLPLGGLGWRGIRGPHWAWA